MDIKCVKSATRLLDRDLVNKGGSAGAMLLNRVVQIYIFSRGV